MKYSIKTYSDKSFVVSGDTKFAAPFLKSMGGRWNPRLKGGAGWIFSNKHREQVALFLQQGIIGLAVKDGDEK